MRADVWTKGNIIEASSMMTYAKSLIALCNQLSSIDYMSNSFSTSSFKNLIINIRDILCSVYGIQGLSYSAEVRMDKAIASLKGTLDLTENKLDQNTRAQYKKRGLTLVSDCIYISGYLSTQSVYRMEAATESLAIPSMPNKYDLPSTSLIIEDKVVPLSESMSDAAIYYAYGTKSGKANPSKATQETRKGLDSTQLSEKLLGRKGKTIEEVKEGAEHKSESEKAVERKLGGLAVNLFTSTLNKSNNALGLSKYGISLSSLISGKGDPTQMIGGVAQSVLGNVVSKAIGDLLPNSLGGPVGSVLGQVTRELQGAAGSLIKDVFRPGNDFVPDFVGGVNPAIAAASQRFSMVNNFMPSNTEYPELKSGWDAVNPTESSWDLNPIIPSNDFDMSGGYPGQEGYGINNEGWSKWCNDKTGFDNRDFADVDPNAPEGAFEASSMGKSLTDTVNDEKFTEAIDRVDPNAPLTSVRDNLNPSSVAGGPSGSGDPRPGDRSLTLPPEQKRRAYTHPKLTFSGGELILQITQKQVSEGVTPAVKRTFGARLIFVEEKSPISVNMTGFLIDYDGMDNVDIFLETLRKASIVEYDEYFQAKVPSQVTLKIEGNEYKGILTGFSYGKSSSNPNIYQTSIQFIGYELGERDTSSGTAPLQTMPDSSKTATVKSPINPGDMKTKVKQQAGNFGAKALKNSVESAINSIPQLADNYIGLGFQQLAQLSSQDMSSSYLPPMQSPSLVSVVSAFSDEFGKQPGTIDRDLDRKLKSIMSA